MNIALHGMEERLIAAYTGEKSTPTARQRAPKLIRYADDFVVLHAEEGEVRKAQQLIATWLQGIGLELKPSKTRLSHTLNDYQGNVGFNFLGFSIRQFPVGKTHTGASKGKPLGFKTIITPSKEGVQRHVQALRAILQKSSSLSQEQLIDQLNPVIHGWSLYYRTVVSKKRFTVMRLSSDAYALAKDDPKTPQEKRQVGQRALLANNEREYLDICDTSKRNDADASTACIDTHPTPYQGKRPSQPVRRKPAVLGKTTPTSPINENDARKTVTETARKMPMVWTALSGGGTDRNRSYHPKK